MTRIVSVAAFLICVHGATLSALGEKLRWDDPNPPGTVKSFTLYTTGPSPLPTIRVKIVMTNEITLEELFGNAPDGQYQVFARSNDTNGLASEKSSTITVSWAGPGPSADPEIAPGSRAAPCATPVYAAEGTGIVYQVFQDRTHSFAATQFSCRSNGLACRVELKLQKVRTPHGAITVYVWNNARGRPGELVATSSTAIDASSIGEGWSSVQISFRHTGGETYWIGFSNPVVHAQNNVLWVGGGPGARCISADGIAWVLSGNEAMDVRVLD